MNVEKQLSEAAREIAELQERVNAQQVELDYLAKQVSKLLAEKEP